MTKRAIFVRSDFGWAALCTLLSFIVYAWTAAPNVTLQDSGEFLTAAQHFGVPHPTGYPLWTFLAWLFQLLPLGNTAWEINLFSGVCAALAVGVACLLSRSSLRWIFEGDGQLTTLASVSSSLLLAFSAAMWSQATITEVYTLHALIVALYFLAIYCWIRNPAGRFSFLLVFFLLTLAFGHHQLSVTLSPLPFLCVLLLRRRMLPDLLLAAFLTALLVFLGFAILSKDPDILSTAIRFFYCVAIAFGLFFWYRRGRIRWWLVAFLPIVVILALAQYAYLPIASSTNPPMNWGYAREADGFYYSINRSQYSGSLSNQSLGTLGKLMGVTTAKKIDTGESANSSKTRANRSRLEMAQSYVSFYWVQLAKSFTPLAIVFFFTSILMIFRMPLPARTWIYTLHIGFVVAAFLQPLKDSYDIDNSSWWLQLPWHTYTFLIFSLICGVGATCTFRWLGGRFPRMAWLALILPLLPVYPLVANYDSCSQRNHWFGWMFGHDMLKDLPPGSIMIGGTDPGRFVPTYMIFGESGEPAKNKRDPDFKRDDLYIITQNALGEPNYMKYLRDQYTKDRRQPTTFFEKWLGRDKAYPAEPIILPTEEEIREYLTKWVKETRDKGEDISDSENTIIFSATLKWLWEKNRDKHDFFVEESFPIVWTYDYATPHGLSYKINKTKVEKLTPEMVAEDFRFWKEYKERLLGDPAFAKDFDAQRSFSKLRLAMGNIYRHHNMMPEAERVYREALELWPGNFEAIIPLMSMMWDRGEFDDVLKLFDKPVEDDPNNIQAWRLYGLAEQRKKMEGDIRQLLTKLNAQPKSRETLQQLIRMYATVGQTNKSQPLVERAFKDFPNDSDMLRFIVQYYDESDDWAKTEEPSKRLVEIEGSNVQNHLLLVRAYFAQQKKKEFYEAAEQAVKVGGKNIQEMFQYDPTFAPWRNDPEFKKLIAPQPILPE